MAKSEGAKVREAYDGPNVDHDDLIDFLEARMREEHERSSDASESAAKTAEFIEETGLNTQATSWMKSILKKLPKKDGQSKAMDIIRSLEIGLPMIKAHVAGQGSGEMDLGDPVAPPADPVEPMSDEDVEAMHAEMDDADGKIEHVDFREPA